MKPAAIVCALALGANGVLGCSSPEAPAPAPVERELELGPHRVRVAVPMGWDVYDQGLQKRFRKAEAEIVLRDLGGADPARDPDSLSDWALTMLGHDGRRDVKSRQPLTVNDWSGTEIETWNRLAHTSPQRFLFVPNAGHLLALYTPRLADEETVRALESIRDSLRIAGR
jgi:hypothetical protein